MNKTVLITGCSSGFGKASAKLFADKGWNVIATMRRPEAEEELTKLADVLLTRLDVQERDSIGAAIEAGMARFGTIDALMNNAGFGLFGLFEATPREKIEEQFDVNVFGAMDVTRALLPHFRANNNGLILNISSGAGMFTLPMLSLYCASKFALEGFSEALSYELSSQHITVKVIEPGGVVSTNFGIGRMRLAKHGFPITTQAGLRSGTKLGLRRIRSFRPWLPRSALFREPRPNFHDGAAGSFRMFSLHQRLRTRNGLGERKAPALEVAVTTQRSRNW
jgi:NAD(P)-dependent dehydrogenase (short-subunit alcohol dehydrogenase family)